MRLKVENSDIRVKSIYSVHFLIQGRRGAFRLGKLHGHGIGKCMFEYGLLIMIIFI